MEPRPPYYLPPPKERDPHDVKAYTQALPFGVLIGALAGYQLLFLGPLAALIGGIAACAGITALVGAIANVLARGAARAGGSFLMPSGKSSAAPQDFSLEKSLVARGQVRDAIARLERRLAGPEPDPAAMLYVADLCSGELGDAAKGERLYRQARELAGARPEHDLHATNRLVDLYLGPLADDGRAREELRRLIERHPQSRAAAHAQHALRELVGK